MTDKITPTMERVLQLAEIEAKKDKGFLGTQHILIGMMLEGVNFGSLTLSGAGVTLDQLRGHCHNNEHP